jgi:hypothetical protein
MKNIGGLDPMLEGVNVLSKVVSRNIPPPNKSTPLKMT